MNKLLLDENVSGLARWLRFLGIDTEVAKKGTQDSDLVHKAYLENRMLITRDRALFTLFPKGAAIYVEAKSIKEQLSQILDTVGLTHHSKWFLRCTVCNIPLQALRDAEIVTHPEIPDFIKHAKDPAHRQAWHCTNCLRTYWKGSHYDVTEQTLKNLGQV